MFQTLYSWLPYLFPAHALSSMHVAKYHQVSLEIF